LGAGHPAGHPPRPRLAALGVLAGPALIFEGRGFLLPALAARREDGGVAGSAAADAARADGRGSRAPAERLHGR
jgi:hypothetical protein